MLFLNRRGYAGFLSCCSCGNGDQMSPTVMCLYLYIDMEEWCAITVDMRPDSPRNVLIADRPISEGFGRHAADRGSGEKSFPEARVLRMDLDTTRKKESHSELLSAFANQEADILIGTQMIVKIHDFPQVTLVGILAADLSLNVSDYRAGERTFQLLTQAIGKGRKGRESREKRWCRCISRSITAFRRPSVRIIRDFMRRRRNIVSFVLSPYVEFICHSGRQYGRKSSGNRNGIYKKIFEKSGWSPAAPDHRTGG